MKTCSMCRFTGNENLVKSYKYTEYHADAKEVSWDLCNSCASTWA